MSNFTVTIVGAGVIGASLGLALKQIDDPPRLLAHDKELANAQAAVKKGAFDKAEWNLINACEPADLIILAIPLDGIRPTLAVIAPDLKQGVVISDTSRSKKSILTWAEELLPDHAHFVSGNPIVHPPGQGLEHARADLFRRRLYCLTPSPTANEAAVQLLVDVVNLIGAEPFFLDAAEHDGLVTAVEHLPAVLGVSLLNTLSSLPAWREIRKLAGSLFEQVSCGAVGTPEALTEDWLTNRDDLVRWLDSYLEQLNQLRLLIANADSKQTALAQMIDQAVVERYNWLVDYRKGRFIDPELQAAQVETPSFMKRLIGFRR
ncbi:MAG: prephenate dehydrogenase [Anaerolineae bacterium]|nr:prephenate dehydrogenase [Anaerolineae bacterium]